MKPLAYYITAHGFGHGTRSCDILSALLRAQPDLTIHVISDLPRAFLQSRLPEGDLHYRGGSFDVGMVQLDSVRVDVPGSLRAMQQLLQRWPAEVRAEAEFLRVADIGAAVVDIPGIPVQAARRAGLPALAVGNFAWDWIYEPFAEATPAWRPVIEAYRAAYAECDLLLRLPFHDDMAIFPRRRDLPLVARPGRNRRMEMARRAGIDPDTTWALLSFTALEWDDSALERVAALTGYTFLTVLPLAWERPGFVALDRRDFPYHDVMASCDLVVSKPGFGVLSDCAVNAKPIVYVEREHFREYPILEAAIRRHLRHVHLPAQQLYRGELEEALSAARHAAPPNEQLSAGGDDEAASAILDALG